MNLFLCMLDLFFLSSFILLCLSSGQPQSPSYINKGMPGNLDKFHVNRYGAKGDGLTDDSKAFSAAWQAACSSARPSTVYIPPQQKFLLNPLRFVGPCKNILITVEIDIQDNMRQILGKIIAPTNKSLWNGEEDYWLEFKDIKGLRLEGKGFGVLDGQGAAWWPKGCKNHTTKITCNEGPQSLKFTNARNVFVDRITSIDSKQFHVVFQRCHNVKVNGLRIWAPADSPNTDGIHITQSSFVNIRDTVVGTGDDCISIQTGSSHVSIEDGSCGPGHGISIGSLGKDGTKGHVTNVTVKGVTFHDTENGVRIKTWQGGKGFAKAITFRDLTISKNVKNPIIIDQYYCPHCDAADAMNEKPSAVKISDVVFKNIKGTSATEVAITLSCSKSVPCEQIRMEDVQLSYNKGKALCLANNTMMSAMGLVNPPCY